ncbi:MAG: dihydrodipicolinate synthase family protein [Oscillospiraceae bacterium]|nr:dihydrodipicolinate synthase family protein [Oscillospiraceae bacterium]
MASLPIKAYRGIFAILPTPFNADLTVDYGALENIVEFCAACKAQGIVTPANASEQPMLMDAERQRIVEVTVNKAAGRMPVVAGVTSANAFIAGTFARQASAAGADALMAMPPYVMKASPPAIKDYYLAIDRASDVPVIIQNYAGPPVGTPMSPQLMLDICAEGDRTLFIKEENPFSSHLISETLDMAKRRPDNKMAGIMGGKAGKFIIEEFTRGAVGNMPACEIADVHVKIWRLCEEGSYAEAQAMLDLVQPLLNFESIYGSFCYKEVLRRRGVIPAAYVRSVGDPHFDALDIKELDRIMEAITPAFAVK